MKKSQLSIILVSSLSLIIAACASGTSSSSPAPITPAAAPVVNPIVPPAGSSPAVAGGGSSVYYSESNGVVTVNIPQTIPGGTQYTAIQLPAGATTDALVAALNAGQVTSAITYDINTVFQTSTVAYVVSNISAQSTNATQAGSLTTIESTPISGATTPVVPTITGSFRGVSYGAGSSLMLSPYTGSGITPPLPISLSNCTATSGTATAISNITVYAGTYYIGIGDSNGNVCIYDYNQHWTNLTPQATSHGYTASSIKAFAFTNSGNQVLYGSWLTSSGQIWRVAANTKGQTLTSTSCTGTGNCSFWQLNKAGQQSTAGQSATFTNVPGTNINSIYSDASNGLFAGTTAGSLYKLSGGSSNWSAPTTVGTAPVALYRAAAGTGVTAISGNSVFDAQ